MGLNVGEIQFFDNYIPGLAAGIYTITLTQTLTGVGANSSSPDNTQQYVKSQQFTVQAPQVSINSADIHAMFPPAYSSGQFAEKLPYIILNERALPWERALAGQQATVPWLALLVFTEDELLGAAPPISDGSPPQGMAREPSHAGSFVSTCTVAELLEPDPRVLKPSINTDSLDSQQNCQYIDISAATFQAVVPTLAELPYLAHVRRVNTGDSQLLGDQEKGWFAVVTSNRFPAPAAPGEAAGLRNVAHLVSIEGYQNYLTDSPQPFPKMETSGETNKDKNVRLISLANWSFTCLAESGQSFAGLAQGLTTDSQGQALSAAALQLKLLVSPPSNPNDGSANTVAQNRLSAGFVALTYHTLSGEETFSWYRGPLTPAPTHYTAKPSPFLSASGAMIYDKDTGIFDHSLAVAWQLGRNLALASQSFASAFLTLRREARIVVNQWLASEAAQQAQGSDELIAMLQASPSAQQSAQWMTSAMSATIAELSKSGVSKSQIQQSRTQLGEKKSRVRTDHFSRRAPQLLARDEVQDALAQQVEAYLTPVAAWVARLGLLYDVPFDHLVPDAAILPTESIRFFYVDQNWIDALTDGVLSVGMQSGLDTSLLRAMYAQIRQAVYQAALEYRSQISEGTDINPGSADAPETRSGFLLRSAMVSGWPGLIVEAFQANTELKTLRMERLAPDVLLCLFLGVPDRVTLSLPQQNLSFGVLDNGQIDLRNVSGNDVGKPLSSGATLQVYDPNGDANQPYLRPGGKRVLNLYTQNSNEQSISPTRYLVLALQQALGLNSRLTTSQFVIQMIRSNEVQEIARPSNS
jgi:hypothetical protein